MTFEYPVIRVMGLALFSVFLFSCGRVETDPPDFPADPFFDAQTYQGVLNRVAPDEWTVVAFERRENNPKNTIKDAGIIFALSKHNTKDEFLFLYHFLGGRNDAAYSVEGAKGAPQPVGVDIFNPTKVEWKSRDTSLLSSDGFWKSNAERIGNRYPIYGTLEDITVHGRFGNYNIRISFNKEAQDWEFDVNVLEE